MMYALTTIILGIIGGFSIFIALLLLATFWGYATEKGRIKARNENNHV
jgi:hypothetical protein